MKGDLWGRPRRAALAQTDSCSACECEVRQLEGSRAHACKQTAVQHTTMRARGERTLRATHLWMCSGSPNGSPPLNTYRRQRALGLRASAGSWCRSTTPLRGVWWGVSSQMTSCDEACTVRSSSGRGVVPAKPSVPANHSLDLVGLSRQRPRQSKVGLGLLLRHLLLLLGTTPRASVSNAIARALALAGAEQGGTNQRAGPQQASRQGSHRPTAPPHPRPCPTSC